MSDLFEPDLVNKKSYKKHMIIYLVCISIIIILLILYAIISSFVNPWKKYFELKEIKTVLTGSIGKNVSNKDFAIDFIKDIYLNFENKHLNSKDSIKKISFKNIEILDKNGNKPSFNVNVYEKDNNRYLPLNDEQKKLIEYTVKKDNKNLILAFRTKKENVAQMEIGSNYESKQSLSLLKGKIDDKNKDTINYIVKFDIEVELNNGKIFKTEQKIMPDYKYNFDTNIFVKKEDNNLSFESVKIDN